MRLVLATAGPMQPQSWEC